MGIELVILIVVFGLVFDYTNGFHDAANVVATIIATRALTPGIAILMAGFFNILGATQISGVAQTITDGLVEAKAASQLMVLAAVIGAIMWNLVTWYFRIPSSSSYALIGGLVGAALTGGGEKIIIWKGVISKVAIPMVLSPIIGFFMAFTLMKLFYLWGKRWDKAFRYLQIGSAACVALAHGMNDAQKSMGIITLGLLAGGVITESHIPLWVVAACALTLGFGTAFGGLRIIRTVGYEITTLKPVQGFASELSSSLIILSASMMGMPVSSTQMIVGSVTGVGAARGSKAVHWALAHKMILTWVLTFPGSGLIASGIYKLTLLLMI